MIILILGSLKDKVKMSEDDIKTIFFVLDQHHKGIVTAVELESLKEGVQNRLREFYKSRINREMVKVLLPISRILSSNLGKLRTMPSRYIRSKMPHCFSSKTYKSLLLKITSLTRQSN